MDGITKQAIIWGLIIVFGGGIVSALLGQGFWGEKRPQGSAEQQTQGPDERGWVWGSGGPNLNAQCTDKCESCHPDFYKK